MFSFASLLSPEPARRPARPRQGVGLTVEGLTYRPPGPPGRKSAGKGPVAKSRAPGEDRARSGKANTSPEGVSPEASSGNGAEHDGTPVLHGLDLHIQPGEFVVIVGPSGCGKSTLLNLIAGLLAPEAGRILSDGELVGGASFERALVFQDAALFPWLTLGQNIEFPLKVQKMPASERRARAKELLALVHLEAHENAYPHELSGGMRQRGAIARALATDPSVLLMDEPFASLDPHTRERLQDELERVWLATKKTVVFVTHSIEEAVRLGDRVLVLGDRPARFIKEIVVDLPRPRSLADEQVVALARSAASAIPRKSLPRESAAPQAVEPIDAPSPTTSSPRLRVGGRLGAGL